MTQVLTVFDPYRGDLVVELPFDDEATVGAKLAAARAAFGRWRRVPVAERTAAVRAAMGYFETHAEDVARDVTRQMGKPLEQARNEVRGMLGRAEWLIENAAEALAPDLLPTAADGSIRRIEHVPHGVVLDIAAWNYPLLIAVNVIVPAVLAGNAVLIKHSARTPLCGVHFERAFAGIEQGELVANLVLRHPETALLIADERVDYVGFTGSVEGGRAVQGSASDRFIDVGLELGGKDPAYVAADADLDTAVAGVVDGACYNAGQSCCAVERIYVHASRYEAFLERAADLVRAYRLGDPLDSETTMGPLATRSALDVLDAQVVDATARGARVLVGGARVAGQPPFFQPTLLADCAQDALVMQEESFGPLVPVRAVADDDEALALMNDSRFGLTASVWTRDAARAARFATELEAGTIYQNRCDALDPALPWTGVKDSGRGSTLSRYGFLQLTWRKSVWLRA